MSAFHRLHPRLRHAVVHDLGWRALRPVQELACEAILDGHNAVVLAPTAGGKTEASMFPVLSGILSAERPPVAALYVCPIRALLNNQEHRLQRYARMVGLEAFKWHGDVAPTRKRRFVADPAHLLMTTPESLEAMLMSAWVDPAALFAGLEVVVIDEVHAFAGDDRGAHLVSLLERLTAFCGRDVQRVGLSATVGNPGAIGAWLQGSSARPFTLVDPPKPPPRRALRVDFCPEPGDLGRALSALARGAKSLVFVESRRQAEAVARDLALSPDLDVYVHHSAVSRADRERAEAMFEQGGHASIVCTSTMELGIDVGDLDRVLQVGAPTTVASFLQRLGRTGRREGAVANCSLCCDKPEALLQAVAVLRLADRGWVEDVRPKRRALHVLAHQILALTLQEGGVSRHRVQGWVAAATPFSDLAADEVQGLVDAMLDRDILHAADGRLSLGHRGEALYGHRNFFELYAVFSAPAVLRVLHGKEEVGTLQAAFVHQHDPADGPLFFRLGGRAWRLIRADFTRGAAHVEPAPKGAPPRWLGLPGMLSWALCQEMKATLREEGPEPAWLTPAAAAELAALRGDYAGLVEEGEAPLEEHPSGVQWHTFAGGSVNRLLAATLGELTGARWSVGNLSLVGREVAMAQATEAVARLRDLDLDAAAHACVADLTRGPLSKFQPCLPEPAERALMIEALLDVPRTRRFLADVRVPVAT